MGRLRSYREGTTAGALTGLPWGAVAVGVFFVVHWAYNAPDASRLWERPASFALTVVLGTILSLMVIFAVIGAVLGVAFVKLKDMVPTKSTVAKSVIFFFTLWLLFQLTAGILIATLPTQFAGITSRDPGPWSQIVGASGLVTVLLWGASFGYFYDRRLRTRQQTRM